MKLDVLKLIYDNIGNECYVSEEELTSLVMAIVDYKDLHDYIKNFKLEYYYQKDDDKVSVAKYVASKKAIYMYINGVTELYQRLSQFRLPLNVYERNIYNYLVLIQILLHEIEHANQSKIMNTSSDIESTILKYSTGLIDRDIFRKLLSEGYSLKGALNYTNLLKFNRDINYENNYNNAPHERIADIKAWEEVQDITGIIKEDVPYLHDFVKYIKYQKMFSGYEQKDGEVISPTIEYLIQSGYQEQMDRFDWYNENYNICLNNVMDDYILKERMLYGLPISMEEYNVIDKTLNDYRVKRR